MPSLKTDFQLTLATLAILSTSILAHISLSPERILSHTTFIIIGLLLAFLASQIDSKFIPFFWVYLYILTLVILIIPLVLGVNTRGASRWIYIGPFQLQPSEFAKVFLVISLSQALTLFTPSNLKNLGIISAMISLPMLLIFLQPDLGSALILGAIAFSMVFVAAIRFRVIFILAAIMLALAPISWHSLKPYQKSRIHTFLDPTADPLGEGYNTIQSIIAVGSGKFFGKGMGRGSQSQLSFLPEHQTDFIFAAYSEEFGFLGSVILISLYSWLLWRILQFATKPPDKFAYFFYIGVFAMIFSQFAINIGMNLGVLPVTGITLPLFSAGGSSIIATLITLGLVSKLKNSDKKLHPVEIT